MDAPSPRRHRALLVRVLAGLLLVMVLAGAGLVLCLGHLEWGPCKHLVQSLMTRATGLTVDYQQISLGVSGALEVQGLAVGNPAPWDGQAPDLLRVGRLEARVRMASLIRGRPEIEAVRVEGLALALVQDAEGHGSLDAFRGAGQASAPASGSGPSRSLESLDLGVTVGSLHVSGVSWSRVQATPAGAVIDRVEGLVVEGSWGGPDGEPGGFLRLASDPGTGLSFRRTGPDGTGRGVTLRGVVEVAVDRRQVAIRRAEWDLAGQDLDPRLPQEGPILRATARADLDPEAGTTTATFQAEVLGALSLEGALEVRDPAAGDHVAWVIRDLRVSGDSGRLPEWLWGLTPGLEVRDALFSAEVAGFGRTGDGAWRLPDRLTLAGKAARVAWAPKDGVPLEVEGMSWIGTGLPGDAGTGAPGLRVEVAGRRIGARSPGLEVEMAGWTVSGRLEDVLGLAEAREVAGDLRLEAEGVRAVLPEGVLAGQGVTIAVEGRGGDGGLARGRGDLAARAIRWTPRRGSALEPGPVRLTLDADEVRPADPPWSSAGRVRAVLESAWVRGRLEADSGGGSARVGLDLAARSLGFAAPWLPRGIPLAPMSATVRLAADLSDLAGPDPAGQGALSVTLDRPSAPGGAFSAARAVLDARFAGRGSAPEVDGSLTLASPRVQGRLLADMATVSVRGAARPGDLRGDLEVRAVGQGRARADGRTRVAVVGSRIDIEGQVHVADGQEWIGLLSPEVAGRISGEALGAQGTWKARFTGATRFRPGGVMPLLAPDVLRTARGEADLDLRLQGLALQGPVAGPLEGVEVTGHAEARDDGWRGRLGLDVAEARLRTEADGLQVRGLGVEVRLSRGTDDGLVAVDLEGRVQEAAREGGPGYPIGDLRLTARGRLVPFQVVRLDSLSLDNPAGGTSLRVQAALEDARGGEGPQSRIPIVVGRRSLSLEGTLTQDLSRTGLPPETFRGRGTVEVPFRVESGDWTLFRVAGAVEARGVDADLPGASLGIEGLDGTVSVFEEVALGAGGGVLLVGDGETNAMSRMRFPDIQPFLARGAYVTFRRLQAGPVTLGPGAGNLRIAGRTVALDQMEADWLGGKVTGQLVLDYRPGDTTMRFRGGVTGVRAGGDAETRLDANAALAVSLDRMEAEGRAQVLRIDRAHLRRALDALDPAWENVALNRVRKYLAYGYPRYVRVQMERGFLSARIDLGGIASVVRIDEVRGIPTGPLLRRLLGPLVPRQGGVRE
ncbi:MAG TPA: hypothetical protein PLQ97_08895 [Myxococcota bacterium]|nr:hypothetical protein [Myxococcota bacterium]HQK51338.1 hypothetical protein [Myxococcota bacterium]